MRHLKRGYWANVVSFSIVTATLVKLRRIDRVVRLVELV